ncbi:HAMP domain-containing histidine kinase [Streptomyces sp. NBC_00444]|uniref:sensor histidine kinase n=1 Tax=Streptomyces sp. NBC_00444 TaxID=2975744 RepID=UPI002E1D17D9
MRRSRTLRTRLVLFISVTLAVVCTVMALATVFVQRAYLLGDLDQRVVHAAERGQAAGMVTARFTDGTIVAAEVVTESGRPRALTAAQIAALAGITADGSLHTRTLPGLGTYRVTAIGGDGTPVLAGLPTHPVDEMINRLVAVEALIAVVSLLAAGGVSAVVVRRRLRPLGRVAATAAEVSRAPLERGEVSALTRVPAADTDPGTEPGQVGAALNRMIEHVESSLAERRRTEERMRRFLADASHELRTPLASIAGYAELMNMAGGQAREIEPALAWRRVSAQSARMTELVEDLLLLARLDEGRPLGVMEVNLAPLVAAAVWDARATGGGHDWRLALRVEPSEATVVGDPARLQQVLANLLANARVHTPVGTTVTVVLEATDTHSVIRVRDDGPGIPPALLPTVFERFTRADASRSRTHGAQGGSGLGLAIAAAITEAHGGRIDVHSEPGRTEFTLTLPTPVAVPAKR